MRSLRRLRAASSIAAVTKARVDKVQEAVRERLESEIRYWDQRTEEMKAIELAGGRPRISSGRARARADDLETRLARRRLELDLEADLHAAPPNIAAAALLFTGCPVLLRPLNCGLPAHLRELLVGQPDPVLEQIGQVGRNAAFRCR